MWHVSLSFPLLSLPSTFFFAQKLQRNVLYNAVPVTEPSQQRPSWPKKANGQPTRRTMTVTLHNSPSSDQLYQYQNQVQHAMWLEQRQVCPTMHKSTQFFIVNIGIMGRKIR
ncbi:hypothetical protein BHYA_0006g00570 [Botrytis hyacinthi]|uniref:Secreted protein n=1 Tax=Botrytis hyacinthi TaxID=278943 RepID=A0A4Z1HCH5_9HELO|nr:hypothetical protein BHYA_0006g00570 [Botrytis hyacinthi]